MWFVPLCDFERDRVQNVVPAGSWESSELWMYFRWPLTMVLRAPDTSLETQNYMYFSFHN